MTMIGVMIRVPGSEYLQQPTASAWAQKYVYDLATRMTDTNAPAYPARFCHSAPQQFGRIK